MWYEMLIQFSNGGPEHQNRTIFCLCNGVFFLEP